MTDVLTPYLLSVVGGLVALFIVGLAYLELKRTARDLMTKEARLPDAVRLETLSADVLNMKAIRDELNEDAGKIREVIQRAAQARHWLEKNEATYERLRQELPIVEAKVALTQRDYEELSSRTKSITQEFATQSMALSVARTEIAAQERARALVEQEIADRRKIHESLEREIRNKQEEWSQLQASQQELLGELSHLRVQKDSAAQEYVKFEQDLEVVSKNVAKAEELLRDLENDVASKLDNLKLLDRQVKRLDEERLSIERLIEAAEKRWTQIAPTVGAGDGQRLAELWSPVLRKGQFEKRRSLASDGELASLSATQSYLVAAGLQYHQRVLYQFHTSLKVADMSPLVVLAGISGTGKSELPRRYAEGMGMYALTLAVQPRWDSPQDMFGFYNYLENRYRATELARALVQLDRFVDERKAAWKYPEEWRKESLKDRMLIVLLDEMNLARVEYYFSEFLSRLETRRGIDPLNADQRRKAEIMLEVGIQSLKKDNGKVAIQEEPTLPIFVDRNVLFVGTMNEDETTQTLSDKVVDRANVLRFGRPSTLKSKGREETVRGESAFLAYEDWESWIRNSDDSLPQNVRSDVTTWVQRLNQAMQRIGRPFAHRTYSAILSYVANYPLAGDFKLAVADQIEMKVMPKLRGLDPQDTHVSQALGEIQSVISELGDDRLLNAIQESRTMDSHQFLWHGVDRMETP